MRWFFRSFTEIVSKELITRCFLVHLCSSLFIFVHPFHEVWLIVWKHCLEAISEASQPHFSPVWLSCVWPILWRHENHFEELAFLKCCCGINLGCWCVKFGIPNFDCSHHFPCWKDCLRVCPFWDKHNTSPQQQFSCQCCPSLTLCGRWPKHGMPRVGFGCKQ